MALRGPWWLRGARMVKGAPDAQRGPAIQRCPCCSAGPLIFRGAPAAQGGPVFLWVVFQRARGPSTVRTCFFGGFPHIFRDFCAGFGYLRMSFGCCGPSARRGPKTPRGRGLPPCVPTSLLLALDFLQFCVFTLLTFSIWLFEVLTFFRFSFFHFLWLTSLLFWLFVDLTIDVL